MQTTVAECIMVVGRREKVREKMRRTAIRFWAEMVHFHVV